MQRFMTFVDGSNVVGVLKKLNLKVEDYEPFYRYLFEQSVATWKNCVVGQPPPAIHSRVLWYAVGTCDEWDFNDSKVDIHLKEGFERNKELRKAYMALAGQKLQGKGDTAAEAWSMCFNEAKDWYSKRRDLVSGFHRFYHSVRSRTDFIDIIECGHWRLDLLERVVQEKGLARKIHGRAVPEPRFVQALA